MAARDWEPAEDEGIAFEPQPAASTYWGSGEYIPVRDASIIDYDGTYSVIPDWEEHVLATNQRFMNDDVTVGRIPTYETSNEYGTTFIIG